MVLALAVDAVADFTGLFFIDVFTQHDALDSPVRVGRNEDVEGVGTVAQDVIGQAADDDARADLGQVTDDLRFFVEEHLPV